MPNPSNYYEPHHQLHPKAGKNEDNGSIPPRLAHDYRLLEHTKDYMDFEESHETRAPKSLLEQVARTERGRLMQLFAEKCSNEPEYIMDEEDLDEEDFLDELEEFEEDFSEEFEREINEGSEDEAISEAEKEEDKKIDNEKIRLLSRAGEVKATRKYKQHSRLREKIKEEYSHLNDQDMVKEFYKKLESIKLKSKAISKRKKARRKYKQHSKLREKIKEEDSHLSYPNMMKEFYKKLESRKLKSKAISKRKKAA